MFHNSKCTRTTPYHCFFSRRHGINGQYDPPISFWLELYFESTNEKGRPVVYSLGPNVNNSTPNTLQVLSELLPELKSNTVTPPSDDGIHTLPATEDVSTTESVN